MNKILCIPCLLGVYCSAFAQSSAFEVSILADKNTYALGEPVGLRVVTYCSGNAGVDTNNSPDKGNYSARLEVASGDSGQFRRFHTWDGVNGQRSSRAASLSRIRLRPGQQTTNSVTLFCWWSAGPDMGKMVFANAGKYQIRYTVELGGRSYAQSTSVEFTEPSNDADCGAWDWLRKQGTNVLAEYGGVEQTLANSSRLVGPPDALRELLARYPDSAQASYVMRVVGRSLAARAQAPQDTRALHDMFDAVVRTEGPAYFLVRSTFLARGDEALDFLEEQTSSTNLQARVLARSMLSWAADPDKASRRSALLLDGMQRMAINLTVASRAAATNRVATGGLDPGSLAARRAVAYIVMRAIAADVGVGATEGELRQADATPLLLEAALKGAPQMTNSPMNGGAEVRGFATLLLGKCKDPDAVNVIAEQLKSGQPQARISAIIALEQSGNNSAVEPLLGALGDGSGITELAYEALMKVTGQDFRQGVKPNELPVKPQELDDAVRKQFEDWWRQNKERLLAAPPQPQERK